MGVTFCEITKGQALCSIFLMLNLIQLKKDAATILNAKKRSQKKAINIA